MALDGTGTAPFLCGGDENELLRSPHREILPLRMMDNPLTPQQKEVVEWLSHGKTFGEIAIILDVSYKAVTRRMERVWINTGTSNRHGIVAMALRNHWIE